MDKKRGCFSVFRLFFSILFCLFSPILIAEEYYWIGYPGSFTSKSPAQSCREAIESQGFSYYAGMEKVAGGIVGCYGTHKIAGHTASYASAVRVRCPSGILRTNPGICAPSASNTGNNPNLTCNPINIAVGNKFFRTVDYQDSDFTVSRSYNSYRGYWTFNYTQTLDLEPDVTGFQSGISYTGSIYSLVQGSIHSHRPDGSGISFRYGGNGLDIYDSPSQRKERLRLVDPNYINQVIETYNDTDEQGVPTQPNFLAHTHDLITSDNNSIEEYDSEGKLIAIRGLNQGSIHLNYEPPYEDKHWPSRVVINKNGRHLTYVYDEEYFRIKEIILPDTTRIRYDYFMPSAANGQQHRIMQQVTYIDSANQEALKNQYLFESENIGFRASITGVIDENGNRISSVRYDVFGRAISSERGPLNSGIERTQIQYNNDGTRTLTNALGKKNIYHFTQFNGEYKMTQVEGLASENCASANKNYTYDTNGFMASKTDWKGNTTTYINNDRGQVLARTEASGTPQARTITTEWHAEYNLPTKITEPSRITTMTYDTNGRLLSRNITER